MMQPCRKCRSCLSNATCILNFVLPVIPDINRRLQKGRERSSDSSIRIADGDVRHRHRRKRSRGCGDMKIPRSRSKWEARVRRAIGIRRRQWWDRSGDNSAHQNKNSGEEKNHGAMEAALFAY